MRNINLSTDFNVRDLLKKLRANRALHEQVVQEAREGYLKQAQEVLKAKLALMSNGKIVALTFNLNLPECHLDAYDTVIQMLELTTEKKVKLSGNEFRQFVMDEWDWTDGWLLSNSSYSSSSSSMASLKGLL